MIEHSKLNLTKQKQKIKLDGMYLRYYPVDNVYTKTKDKSKATTFDAGTALLIKNTMKNVELVGVK